ncbi:hypothetical protein Tco_0175527 [Tanacetum coccineum]
MQTTEEKVDSSKALDASLVNTESSGTSLKEQDTSSRSGNDSHADDADIRPISDEEPMVTEISLTNVDENKPLNVSAVTLQDPLHYVHKTLDRSRSSLGLFGNDVLITTVQTPPPQRKRCLLKMSLRPVPQGQEASVMNNSGPRAPKT